MIILMSGDIRYPGSNIGGFISLLRSFWTQMLLFL